MGDFLRFRGFWIGAAVGILAAAGMSADSSGTAAGGFYYSEWLQTDADISDITAGSFVVKTSRPFAGLRVRAENIVRRETESISVRDALSYALQDTDLSGEWALRMERAGWEIADFAVHQAFAAATEDGIRRGFLRTAELDWQTGLGGRRANAGVNFLGALREKADDAIAWQLRAFKTNEDAGGNAGLIYRRVVGDYLAGGNVFLDYETHDADNFLRWSLGGELRSEWLDVFANYYAGITDDVETAHSVFAGERVITYTADGYDLEINMRTPDIRWLIGAVSYYNFEGKYEQADDDGIRAGVKLRPLQANVRLDLYYDSGDNGNDFGGGLSFKHEFGEKRTAAVRGGKFDPRNYFFEPAEREYTQRIRQVTVGLLPGRRLNSIATVNIGFSAAGTVSIFFNGEMSTAINTAGNSYESTVTVSPNNQLRLITDLANDGKVTLDWAGNTMIVGSDVEFDGATVSLNYGNISMALLPDDEAAGDDGTVNDVVVALPMEVAEPGEPEAATMAMVSVVAGAEMSLSYGSRDNPPGATMQIITMDLDEGAAKVTEMSGGIELMVSAAPPTVTPTGTVTMGVSLQVSAAVSGEGAMISMEFDDPTTNSVALVITMDGTTLDVAVMEEAVSLNLEQGEVQVSLTSGIELMVTMEGTELGFAEMEDGEVSLALETGEAMAGLMNTMTVIVTMEGTELGFAEMEDGEVSLALETGEAVLELTNTMAVMLTAAGTTLEVGETGGTVSLVLESGGAGVQTTTAISVELNTGGTDLQIAEEGGTVGVSVSGGGANMMLDESPDAPQISVLAESSVAVAVMGENAASLTIAVAVSGGSEVVVVNSDGMEVERFRPLVPGGQTYNFPISKANSSALARRHFLVVAEETADLKMEAANIDRSFSQFNLVMSIDLARLGIADAMEVDFVVPLRGTFLNTTSMLTSAILATLIPNDNRIRSYRVTPEGSPFTISVDADTSAYVLRLEDENFVPGGVEYFAVVSETDDNYSVIDMSFASLSTEDECRQVFRGTPDTYTYNGGGLNRVFNLRDLLNPRYDDPFRMSVNFGEPEPDYFDDKGGLDKTIRDAGPSHDDNIEVWVDSGYNGFERVTWRSGQRGPRNNLQVPPVGFSLYNWFHRGKQIAFAATSTVTIGDGVKKYYIVGYPDNGDDVSDPNENEVLVAEKLEGRCGDADFSNDEFYVVEGVPVKPSDPADISVNPLIVELLRDFNAPGSQTQLQADGTYKMSLHAGEMPYSYLWGFYGGQTQTGGHAQKRAAVEMIVDDNDPNSPFTSYGYSYAGSPYKVSNVRFYFVSFKPDHVLQQQQYVVTVRLFDRGAFSAATPDVLFTLTLDVELPDANPPSFAAAAGLFAENVTVTAIQTNGGGFVAAESDGEPPYRRNAAFHGRDVLYPHTYETGHAAVISITQNAEHFMEIVLPSNAAEHDIIITVSNDSAGGTSTPHTPDVVLTLEISVQGEAPLAIATDVEFHSNWGTVMVGDLRTVIAEDLGGDIDISVVYERGARHDDVAAADIGENALQVDREGRLFLTHPTGGDLQANTDYLITVRHWTAIGGGEHRPYRRVLLVSTGSEATDPAETCPVVYRRAAAPFNDSLDNMLNYFGNPRGVLANFVTQQLAYRRVHRYFEEVNPINNLATAIDNNDFGVALWAPGSLIGVRDSSGATNRNGVRFNGVALSPGDIIIAATDNNLSENDNLREGSTTARPLFRSNLDYPRTYRVYSDANSTDYLAEGDRTSERRHACNNLATDEFWIDANGAETNQVNQARRFNPSPPNSGS